MDIYFNERRNAAAAQAFFERAIARTGVTAGRIVTDRARCYPPAVRAVLPAVEQCFSKYLNNSTRIIMAWGGTMATSSSG